MRIQTLSHSSMKKKLKLKFNLLPPSKTTEGITTTDVKTE